MAILPKVGIEAKEDRGRVHLALPGVLLKGEMLRKREEARGRLVTKASASEMDAYPEPSVLVGEQIDVVVSGADRAQLPRRKIAQLALRGKLSVPDCIEYGMLDRLVVHAPDAEGDTPDDLFHDRAHLEIARAQVGLGRLVTACDVVADS